MEFDLGRNSTRPYGRRQPNALEEMKKEAIRTLRAFLIELAVYTVLVVAYFFLVLHFLGGWLHHIESHNRYAYATVAIVLIIGQAVLLQYLTTFLLRIIRDRSG